MTTTQKKSKVDELELFTQLLQAEAEFQKNLLQALDSLKIQKIRK